MNDRTIASKNSADKDNDFDTTMESTTNIDISNNNNSNDNDEENLNDDDHYNYDGDGDGDGGGDDDHDNDNDNDNDDNNILNSKPTIPFELSKQLLKHSFTPNNINNGIMDSNSSSTSKRVPNDTAKAVSELLRLFVLEARSRACLEAECDVEGSVDDTIMEEPSECIIPIRADHITKIAAELLMDFS